MKRKALAARAALVVAFWPCMNAVMHACPICFQVEDGHVATGVRAAVAVLIGVTSVVLAGFAAFATRLVRRSAAFSNPGTRESENPRT